MSSKQESDLDQQIRREKVDRLAVNARIFLRQGRLDEMQKAIDELRRLEPESAEAWELQGDLHRRAGDRQAARDAYQRAFTLDPTNADAERKYAELVLFLAEEERARRTQQELVEEPKRRRDKPRNPTLAIIYGCLFPGLGQLYNRHHEKGLLLFFAGAVIIILVVNGIIINPYRGIPAAGRGDGLSFAEQFAMWADNLRSLPWWQWVLAVFGVLVFLAMHIGAVIEAAMVARQEAKEAEQLGIDAPT